MCKETYFANCLKIAKQAGFEEIEHVEECVETQYVDLTNKT